MSQEIGKFTEYKCGRCGESQYVFEGEEERLQQGNCGVVTRWCHIFEKMPPSPRVVHCTAAYMTEYQLDSLPSMYELDRVLNIEAAEEREVKALNKARLYE